MNGTSASSVDSEESILIDESTAPTTPDGSLTFSPILGAVKSTDGIDLDAVASLGALQLSSPAATAVSRGHTRPLQVHNICCIGAGYVGGPTAAVIALQNPSLRVTVVDRDEHKIRRWNSRHPPIYEPGLREVLRVARDGARGLHFSNGEPSPDSSDLASTATSDRSECGSQCEHTPPVLTGAARANLIFSTAVGKCISEADLVLIAVNTPLKSRGIGAGSATDMTSFEAVIAEVARHAKAGAIIVEKSTVPCRTAELVKQTMAIHRPGVHFEILSNPEFLAAGTAVNDLLQPNRVIIGSSTTPSGRHAASALAELYAAWVPRSRIITTDVYSSELAKLVANAMLAQRVSSINSISAICEATGADVDEVAECVGRDQRIGDKFLRAGIGFGGSCFKKDVLSLVYLAESLGLEEVGEYWRQVVKMNEFQHDRFARRIIRALNNTLRAKKITILGYAFKKNTSDTRESPALHIIRTLLDEGPMEVAVFDPACNPSVIRDEIAHLLGSEAVASNGGPLMVYGNAYEACQLSDAIVIATEFDEFKTPTPAPAPSPPSASPAQVVRLGEKKRNTKPTYYLKASEADLPALKPLLSQAYREIPREDDPLGRFCPEPDCETGCPDCDNRGMREYQARERLDWARIAYHMREPKWVFDGRGVVDPVQLGKFGVRVEGVGRQGRC